MEAHFSGKLQAAFQSQKCDSFMDFGAAFSDVSVDKFVSALQPNAVPHFFLSWQETGQQWYSLLVLVAVSQRFNHDPVSRTFALFRMKRSLCLMNWLEWVSSGQCEKANSHRRFSEVDAGHLELTQPTPSDDSQECMYSHDPVGRTQASHRTEADSWRNEAGDTREFHHFPLRRL